MSGRSTSEDTDLAPDPAGLGVLVVSVPPSGPHGLPGLAAGLEGAGATALWVTDHLLWHRETLDCLSAVAVLASATDRCAIGPGVLQLPLRTAASVAKTASHLQAASGGRLLLGVGVGEHQGEFDAVGADFATRGRALDRGIDDLRALWARREGTYRLAPQGRPVPIWIGGRSTRAIDRAAVRGDGWLPLFLTADQFERRSHVLDAALAERGRPVGAVRRGVVVIIAPGGEAGTACRWLGDLYQLDPDRFSRYVVAGDVRACAEKLVEYRCAGADHVAVMVAGDLDVPAFHEVNDAFIELAAEAARTEP